jgi:signal transduction histidine kinase
VWADELLAAAARRAEAAFAQAGRPIAARAGSVGALLVLADPGRVAQALDNLIANSLRHGDGPVELTVARAGKWSSLGDRRGDEGRVAHGDLGGGIRHVGAGEGEARGFGLSPLLEEATQMSANLDR